MSKNLKTDCDPTDSCNRVGWGEHPLILVVDMINFFTDPDSPFGADLTACITDINKILNISRDRNIPIFFVSVAYHDADFEGGLMIRKIPALRTLLYGSNWIEVDPRLGRRENEPLLFKEYSSCFFGTTLQSMLQSLRIVALNETQQISPAHEPGRH